MRTYSTPQSALNGEITKLAIIECIFSAALYVGLGVYLGTFKFLAVAVVLAPLMLFRTDLSIDWALKLYREVTAGFIRWAGAEREDDPSVPRYLFMMATLPLIGTAIRIVATAYWAVRRPLHTLSDAPRNWVRQCFCTDFAHPPEVIPKELITVDDDDRRVVGFNILLGILLAKRGCSLIIGIVVLSPFIIVGWIPSLVYRISFKATALAYAPFIWVAHATLRNPLPVKARLERFTKGELEKVRRGVSYIVLTTLVAKGALVFNWIDRAKVESMFPSQKIVTDFVVLDAWPWWQITFGADAVLTFALLYVADAALSRIEAQRPWREESVMTIAATISFLRASFGLATMAHFFHIALTAAAPEWARRLLTF